MASPSTVHSVPDHCEIITWRGRRYELPETGEVLSQCLSEPELRGMFERVLCVARSLEDRTVGNIELADRLIRAVRTWLGTGP